MADDAEGRGLEIGVSPISARDFALPSSVKESQTIPSNTQADKSYSAAETDAPAPQDHSQSEPSKAASKSGRFIRFSRMGSKTENRGAEISGSQQPMDTDDTELADEATPSAKGSTHEPDSGYCRLETILSPTVNYVHYVDIVAVHDYDETIESWTYKDKEQLLRQKIDYIKAKRNRLQDDLLRERVSIGSREGGEPNPNPSKTGSAHDFTGLSPVSAHVGTPAVFSPGRPTREDPGKDRDTEGTGSSRHTEAGSSRASSPLGRVSGLKWLQDATMLPRMLPGARVVAFSYPKLNMDSKDTSQADYIDNAASELLRELARVRPSGSADYDKVPVVFIGAGLGGVIVQKAISLAASNDPSAASSPGNPEPMPASEKATEAPAPLPLFNLDHLASIIFLDTPFPEDESSDLKGFFPLNVNVRMCAVVEMMEMMKSLWNSADMESIWSEFWASLCHHRGQEARVVWFYSTGRLHSPSKKLCLISEDGDSQAITLHPLSSNRLRRLTNFYGPDDPGYKWIMTRLCGDLMLRAVRDERSKELQHDLMRAGSPVNAKDERGLSLLHRAATAPNPAGVNMLLGNHANPQARDPDGQTPLHCAMRMFCEGDAISAEDKIAERITRGRLKKIIEQLLDFTRKSELYNSRDKWGVAPHDLLYGDKKRGDDPFFTARMDKSDYNTIRELLSNHQPVVSRRLEEAKEQPWKGWGPPFGNTAAMKACERAKAIVAEFYSDSGGDSGGILADYDVPSVFELIYEKDHGPGKILSRLTERHVTQPGNVRCRWIHVPANNEQWLQDLFIRLRLKDGSMMGQRHSGHGVFNRYLVAQAKRYKQEKFVPSIEVQSPPAMEQLDPIPEDSKTIKTKKKQADTGFIEILKAEGRGWPTVPIPTELGGGSDAIVLFMPILAYEKHRARKVMSRAIQKASKPSDRRPSPTWGGTSHIPTNNRDEWAGPVRNAEIDTSLIWGYLHSERPLHCRRTLDQYSYYMLETTETRDLDQVVYKWARKQQSRQKNNGSTNDDVQQELDETDQGALANVLDTEVIYRVTKRSEGSIHEGGDDGTVDTVDNEKSYKAEPANSSEEKDGSHKIPREAKHRPIIMVDQLWLWILPDGTVVTSLPNTANAGDAYNLKTRLEVALFDNHPSGSPVQSVDDLVQAILKICVDFSLREGPCCVKFQNCFQYSISDIAEEEANMYATYKKTVRYLEALGPAALSNVKKIDTFSQVTNETNRLVEIMDIQDELKIVDSVLATQKNVLQTLMQQITMQKRSSDGERRLSTNKNDSNSTKEKDDISTTSLRDAACVKEALGIVEDHIRSVAEMINSAKRVQEDLKQLLDFKQQQSNAWETRFSRKLAEQGQKQNNIMLVFTLVTIVFLPMSFISSFFALGVEEFPKDPESGNTSWPINKLSAYLFGISISLSLPLIITAFYVNPISRMVKGKRKRDLHYRKKASLADRAEGYDSDDSDSDSDADTVGEVADTKRRLIRRRRKTEPTFYDEDEEDYAPLFGRRGMTIHTKIPLVRRMWEYKTYRLPELEDFDALENLEWDYPLSRWRKKIAEPVEAALAKMGLRKLSRVYVDYVNKYRLERESDELIRELLQESIELQEQLRSIDREKEKEMEQDRDHDGGIFEKSGRTGTGGTSMQVRLGSDDEETQGGGGGFMPRTAFRRALSGRGLRRRATDEESRAD